MARGCCCCCCCTALLLPPAKAAAAEEEEDKEEREAAAEARPLGWEDLAWDWEKPPAPPWLSLPRRAAVSAPPTPPDEKPDDDDEDDEAGTSRAPIARRSWVAALQISLLSKLRRNMLRSPPAWVCKSGKEEVEREAEEGQSDEKGRGHLLTTSHSHRKVRSLTMSTSTLKRLLFLAEIRHCVPCLA